VAVREEHKDRQNEDSNTEGYLLPPSDSPRKKNQKKKAPPPEENILERNWVLDRNQQMNKFVKITARGEEFRWNTQTEMIPPKRPVNIKEKKACIHVFRKMNFTGKLKPPTLYKTGLVEHKLS
jgi:hypothetical protein